MSVATVTSKGQVTIPAEIRRRFSLEPGVELMFFEDLDGRLQVSVRRPRPDAGRGLFKIDGSPRSDEEIDAGIAEAVEEELGPSGRPGVPTKPVARP